MDQFLQNLFPIIIMMVTPIILVLAHRLLKKLELEKYSDKVDGIIQDSISFAEEQVKKGGSLTGREKLNLAVEFSKKEFEQYKIAQILEDHLTQKIEAKLFQTRSGSTAPPSDPKV